MIFKQLLHLTGSLRWRSRQSGSFVPWLSLVESILRSVRGLRNEYRVSLSIQDDVIVCRRRTSISCYCTARQEPAWLVNGCKMSIIYSSGPVLSVRRVCTDSPSEAVSGYERHWMVLRRNSSMHAAFACAFKLSAEPVCLVEERCWVELIESRATLRHDGCQ